MTCPTAVIPRERVRAAVDPTRAASLLDCAGDAATADGPSGESRRTLWIGMTACAAGAP